MVDIIGFTGVSALMSSNSYTPGAKTMYFFPSATYPPVIPFKRGGSKLPRTGASKGARKNLLLVLKFLSAFLVMFLDSHVLESHHDFC